MPPPHYRRSSARTQLPPCSKRPPHLWILGRPSSQAENSLVLQTFRKRLSGLRLFERGLENRKASPQTPRPTDQCNLRGLVPRQPANTFSPCSRLALLPMKALILRKNRAWPSLLEKR